MKVARLLLRLALGGLFFGHGTQKLFGWFGGHGPDGTGQFFETLGIKPGRANALAAGAAEAGGGVALALGAATPLAAAAITSTMLTAMHRVHLKNGPWVSDGGFEYNLVVILAVLTLAETGPGKLSLDAALGRERSGPVWGLAAAAAGVIGALGAHRVAESQADQSAQAGPVPEPAGAPVGDPATA